MGEKSSAAENSSIFESLFGGFSNGLSIFTNNPFRRKSERSSTIEEDSNRENDDEFASKKLVNEGASGEEAVATVNKVANQSSAENTGNLLDERKGERADGDVEAANQAEHYSDNSPKKAKRAEDDVVSEKKRRRTESAPDIADGENATSGSSDSRKRKQESAVGANAEKEAGLDDTVGRELWKKMKKKCMSGAPEYEQQVMRQSTRNMKKRQNEAILLQRGGQKERKLDKTSAIRGELESEDKGLKPSTKRSQEAGGGEKHKKKTKRLDDIELEKHGPNKGTEEAVPAAPAGMETRLGSKRKKDGEVEEPYGRKRRGTVEEQENSRLQGNGEEEVAAEMDIAERLRGKRKLSSEDDGKDEVQGAKKKKTRREERIDNEDRLKRTIFVGNLPVSVKTKQLSREFSQFGVVESARLRSVPLVDTKLPRKAAVITGQLNESRSSMNGYVVFQMEESARAALAHNMTEFHGKHLRVDMATTPRKADKSGEYGIEYDRARSIFVGNLPFDVEDEEVYSLFKGKNPDLEVEAVRIVRDPQTSAGKGFAFVCFKKKVGAITALENAEYMKLRNRHLRIFRFGFQKKQIGGNLPARTYSQMRGAKPRPGAQEGLNRKSVLSYEGTRSSKVGGRAGKLTGPARTSYKGNSGERIGPSNSGKTGKKDGPSKRPAVAARKLAAQGRKADTVGTGGGKKEREEKGKKVDSRGKKKKLFWK